MKHKKNLQRTSIVWLYFALVAILILVIATLIMSAVMFLLFRRGDVPPGPAGMFPLDFMIILGAILGTVVAILVIKQVFKPIERISKGLRRVAEGDFSVRLTEKSMFGDIREMYGDFNAMTQQLAGVETLRSDFVANVSHEFKTPLSAIEGYAALLQGSDVPPERAREYLGKIVSNAQKLSVLTGNILTLTKLERQERVTETSSFRLDEHIRKAILLLEHEWSAKEISFDLTLPPVEYRGDAGILFHVWYNLIGNAVKFSPEKSTVRVQLRAAEDNVEVEVEDTGCGIEADALPHIFEKFYQGDTSHSAEGNGLGLAICRSVCQQCGFSLTYRFKEGMHRFIWHFGGEKNADFSENRVQF